MKRTFFMLTILFATCLASSNTFILSGIPFESPSMRFVFKHPMRDESFPDLSALSGTYELSGAFALNGVIDATACIPYVSISSDEGGSESTLGNITVGISSSHQHWQQKGWTGTLTMSLPTMAEDSATYVAASTGMITSYFRGFGKYSQKTLALEAIYSSVRRQDNSNLILGFEIGPVLWIPVDGGGTQVFLEYGALASTELSNVNFSLELVGLATLSSSGNSGDRFNHAVVLGGHWVGTAVKPGVFYQMNLGNISDTLNGVLGLDVEIGL